MDKSEKTKITTKTGRIKKTYECIYCNYFTTKKTDYFRHLKRKKHLNNVEKTQKNLKNGNEKKPTIKKRKTLGVDFCVCGKHFKTTSGIWKHKKKCD